MPWTWEKVGHEALKEARIPDLVPKHQAQPTLFEMDSSFNKKLDYLLGSKKRKAQPIWYSVLPPLPSSEDKNSELGTRYQILSSLISAPAQEPPQQV